MPLGEALRRTRGHRPFLLPYLMVDRSRRRSLGATVRALRDAGATALELGFPFSDPIADGPVLEAADVRALRAGTNWSDLLRAVAVASPVLPTAVMTYSNPVWQRGLRRGVRELRRAGASGLIVPDLPWEESAPWARATCAEGLDLVLFAAPGSSPARTEHLARQTRGFLYLVSRYGTTGGGPSRGARELRPLVRAAHRAAPGTAVLVGFGVRDRASRDAALATGADGVIVGTALEERLAAGDSPRALGTWLSNLARGAPPGGAG